MFIRNPLQLRYPIVDLDDSQLKASIDAFLQLLIASNKYDSIADQDFGFCLEDFFVARRDPLRLGLADDAVLEMVNHPFPVNYDFEK